MTALILNGTVPNITLPFSNPFQDNNNSYSGIRNIASNPQAYSGSRVENIAAMAQSTINQSNDRLVRIAGSRNDQIKDNPKTLIDSQSNIPRSKRPRPWQKSPLPIARREKKTTNCMPPNSPKGPISCKVITIQGDKYFFQKNISIGNTKINLISKSLDNEPLIKKLHGIHSRFLRVFSEVLNKTNTNTEEHLAFNIVYSSERVVDLVTLHNIIVDRNIFYQDDNEHRSVMLYPSIDIEDQYARVLLDSYISIDPIEDSGNAYLDMLDDTLLDLINPQENFDGIRDNSARYLRIEDIIADNTIIMSNIRSFYYYKLTKYLFEEQKPIFDKILIYRKNGQNNLLQEELKKLSDLNIDFNRYLGNPPPAIRRRRTTIKPTTTERMLTTRRGLLKEGDVGEFNITRYMEVTGMWIIVVLGSVLSPLLYVSRNKDGEKRAHSHRGPSKTLQSRELHALNSHHTSDKKRGFFKSNTSSLQRNTTQV